MNFELQSPRMTTRQFSKRVTQSREASVPKSGQEVHILRSWYEYDSETNEANSRGRINWNAIWGIAIVAAISAGFWAGVGMFVARFLR